MCAKCDHHRAAQRDCANNVISRQRYLYSPTRYCVVMAQYWNKVSFPLIRLSFNRIEDDCCRYKRNKTSRGLREVELYTSIWRKSEIVTSQNQSRSVTERGWRRGSLRSATGLRPARARLRPRHRHWFIINAATLTGPTDATTADRRPPAAGVPALSCLTHLTSLFCSTKMSSLTIWMTRIFEMLTIQSRMIHHSRDKRYE